MAKEIEYKWLAYSGLTAEWNVAPLKLQSQAGQKYWLTVGLQAGIKLIIRAHFHMSVLESEQICQIGFIHFADFERFYSY